MYLLTQRDRVVSKRELLDQLWAGEFVTESVLPTNVAAVRRVLRDVPGGTGGRVRRRFAARGTEVEGMMQRPHREGFEYLATRRGDR